VSTAVRPGADGLYSGRPPRPRPRTAPGPIRVRSHRPPRSTRSHLRPRTATAHVFRGLLALARPAPEGYDTAGRCPHGFLQGCSSGSRTRPGSVPRPPPLQPSVLRMIPVAAASRQALRGERSVPAAPLPSARTGAQTSRVAYSDVGSRPIASAFGARPVVLYGHSMWDRAAVPPRLIAVSAVAGLAPWLPPGEPRPARPRRVAAPNAPTTYHHPAETTFPSSNGPRCPEVRRLMCAGRDHPYLRRALPVSCDRGRFSRTPGPRP